MKYFTLKDLTDSHTAQRLGIDNTPSEEVVKNLNILVETILDPLREAWQKPIMVNSGYRCPTLNNAVGGVCTSQHLKGKAADITAGSPIDNRKLWKIIIDRKLPFDQLIGERDMRWIHISWAPKPRGQTLHL